MNSKIAELEREVWGDCIRQRLPKSETTAEEWQKDEYRHLSERFLVEKISDQLLPLVDQAIAEWETIEQQALNRLQLSRESFLDLFQRERDSFILASRNHSGSWRPEISKSSVIYGQVKYLDIVNLFAWILPQAVPGREKQLIEIGKMVTAFF